MCSRECIQAGDILIPINSIDFIDCSEIEQLIVKIYHRDQITIAKNIHAIEICLLLKPSILEHKKLKWKKHMWMIHNLIGHPLMQILAFCKLYRLAFYVHDITVPRPTYV